MSGFNNGIKPTRLWYLTGRKHFQRVNQDALEVMTRNNPPYTRGKKDGLVFVGLCLSMALAVKWSFNAYDNAAPLFLQPTCPPTERCPECEREIKK